MPDRVIEIPGVGVVEFPESMTDAQVNAASTRLYQNANTGKKQPPVTSWVEQHPKMAQIAKGGLDALPAIGGIVGGVLSAPSGGAATVPGVALGVGAGRGARDLIAEATGLDETTSPVSKGLRIATDTALAAAWQKALPGLVEAAKSPARTAGDLYKTFKDALPVWLRRVVPSLPSEVVKAPAAAILQRPPWQTWPENAAIDVAAEVPKMHLKSLDVLRIKQLMGQGLKQGEAVQTVMNLKATGHLK